MRRLATHPPATASITCIDAPIPIRSSFIRPVKRSASTAPDGTPEKILLSNNFVVRRHVPPWGPNVPSPRILCLPVDKTLSPRNSRNSANELTTLSGKYDTGVSIRWSRACNLFSGHDEDPVFSAVSTHGRECVIFARHSRITNSRQHFSHIDGAQSQVTNWNCFVSVRQSIPASLDLHRVARLRRRRRFRRSPLLRRPNT
jgi:hypothetical protein